MPKVSVIIINWNGLHWLKGCLSSLFTQTYKEIEVIIVDNNSSDDSVAFIRKNYPQIKLIRNKQNLGYAHANNQGFDRATGQFVLFLNNDTVVTKGFLQPLVTALQKNDDIGGVQSRIRLLDKPKYLDSVAAFLTNTGFLYHYGIAKPDQRKYHRRLKTFSAKGACMLFKKSVLEAVTVNDELFDREYFAYFEETDMCYRVWLAGYSIEYVPQSLIYHKMGGSSTTMNNTFIQFHSFKNRINSYLKNSEISSLLLILPIHFCFIQVFSLMYLIRGQVKMFATVQKAIWWNVNSLRQTRRKRDYIQNNIRTVSDSKIFNQVLINPDPVYYVKLLSGLAGYKDRPIS